MSIPVRITERSRRILRSGALTNRVEAWAAESLDGMFSFAREDSPGTPWVVRYTPAEGWYGLFSSLPKARKGAAMQFGFDFSLALIHALGLERPSRPARFYVA